MLTEAKRRRVQRFLVLGGMGLALFFLAVYRPLSRYAAALDEPLLKYWRDLGTLTLQTTSFTGEDLPRIEEALQQVQSSLATLDKAGQSVATLLQLDPAVRAKLGAPFQLIDFQNERLLQLEELGRLAAQQQVRLGPGVAAGFPEYTADRQQPALLWAQLTLLRHLLAAAVNAKVTAVTEVKLPPVQFHASRTNSHDHLAEVALQIQLSGAAPAVARFLQSLPLRAEEIKARGLPEALTNKPALFIDQVFLRKESRDKAEDVRLELTTCGFVYREGTNANW
jgi:hypothetical protein